MSISRLWQFSLRQPGAAGIVRRPLGIYAFFTTCTDNPHDKVATLCAMTKTLTTDVQRKNAERQLFGARRALAHLVELYDSGRWKSLYKEDSFAEAVRQARQAVEHWTDVVSSSAEG
jgi:hypothetical protein